MFSLLLVLLNDGSILYFYYILLTGEAAYLNKGT